MARNFGRKNDKDDATSEPEVNEVADAPIEAEDFDDLMASFTNADDSAAEEEDSEVKNDTAEVLDAEVVNEVEVSDGPTPGVSEAESALSDAAKEIADKATGHTIEMLEVSSLPATVPHITGNLATLNAISDQIKMAVNEFTVGTGNKDEKVKHAIATLNEENDPENYARREAIAKAKAQIAELEEQIERDEPKLYEAVEERLVKEGDTVWSEETINEKRQYIMDMYSGYVAMHKGTEQFIDSHRTHKPADNVGTIDQYHNKLDKPFKRTSSASTNSGVRKSSGAPRNVSVSEAFVSHDGGTSWHKVEGQLVKPDGPMLSNPMFMAAEIARVSAESGNELKARLYSEWYGANGSADGSPIDASEVGNVTDFDFAYKAKDGTGAVAKVRFVKKGAQIDA
jgi:hypothetical protein